MKDFEIPQRGLSTFKLLCVQSAICSYKIPTFHQFALSMDKLISNLIEWFVMA